MAEIKERAETESERTKLQAEAAKLTAEAILIAAQVTKTEAEARKERVEAEKLEQEVRTQRAEAEVAEITRARVEQQDAEERSRDRYHQVYRFDEPIGGISVDNCIQQLNIWRRTKPGCPIEMIFSSPGGSVFSGMLLFDHLRALSDEGHMITTGTQGFAASMAGILLQAGDHRWCGREAYILIHQVSTLAVGKLPDMEDEVKFLKMMSDRVLTIFATKAAEAKKRGTAPKALTKHQFATKWDRKDWWVTSPQALEWGIVDEVR